MVELNTDESREVRAEDAFDVAAVVRWLDRGPIDGVRQFPGGASNLTYLLEVDGRELILRRPPSGTKAKGAHDMGREYRIQQALAPVFPYVPEMIGYAHPEESPIGAEFYVMAKIDGIIPRRDFPVEVTHEQADELCRKAVDVLVALHSVDVSGVPELDVLNKGAGYVDRQIGGWTKRLEAARTDDLGDWSDIESWLTERKPADVAQAMIHNDYRFDNLVLAPAGDGFDIAAVLDWELATVGDPLMDLGCTLAYWVQADDDDFFRQFRRQPTTTPGMWTREQVVARYCEQRGYSLTPEQWKFYEVYGLFRLAGIAQQIWYRYFHGQTTNEALAAFGPAVAYLEQRCRAIIAG